MGSTGDTQDPQADRLPKRIYEEELYRLQAELVKMQEWIRLEGLRVVVLVALKFALVVAALVGVLAVLRLAFGVTA